MTPEQQQRKEDLKAARDHLTSAEMHLRAAAKIVREVDGELGWLAGCIFDEHADILRKAIWRLK